MLRSAALLGKDLLPDATNLLVQCPAIRGRPGRLNHRGVRPKRRDPRNSSADVECEPLPTSPSQAGQRQRFGKPLATLPLAGRVPQLGRASAIAEVGRGCNRGQRNRNQPRSHPPPSSATSLSLLASLPPPQGGRWSPPCPKRAPTEARNKPPRPSAPRRRHQRLQHLPDALAALVGQPTVEGDGNALDRFFCPKRTSDKPRV